MYTRGGTHEGTHRHILDAEAYGGLHVSPPFGIVKPDVCVHVGGVVDGVPEGVGWGGGGSMTNEIST